MKTMRLRRRIYELLDKSDKLTTREIVDDINKKFHHGTTYQQAINVLSKDIKIMKNDEKIMIGGATENMYKAATWSLKGKKVK